MKPETLKLLLEKETTKIILDTNILLDLSRFSYHTSKYILNLLTDLKSMIWIPNQVFKEYNTNRDKVFSDALKRYGKFEKDLTNIVDSAKKKIENSLKNSYRYHYIDNEYFSNNIKSKLEEVKNLIQSYRNTVPVKKEFSKEDWNKLLQEINLFVESIKVGDKFNTKKILEIISEGELRFKYKIPPGFEDNKKEGIEKFGDLILWKQILELPKSTEVENIIFITNDEKDDWWSISKDGAKEINKDLLDEFKDLNPNVKINFMTLKMFQEKTSKIFSKDAIDVFIELNRDDESYVERISSELERKITSDIDIDYGKYLDHLELGTEGVDNVEIESCYFTRINNVSSRVEDGKICIFYNLEYYISLYCDSYNYWGRDEDTKEVITSPPQNNHIEGCINIEIKRIIDKEIISNNSLYLTQDENYEDFLITDSNLTLKYINQYLKDFDTDYFEYTYSDVIEDNKNEICSDCGNPFNDFRYDFGGKCNNCSYRD